MKRRDLLKLLSFLPFSARAMSFFRLSQLPEVRPVITSKTPIDFQWPVQGPFLFCVHHHDRYPAGNKNYGLDPKHFFGRNMGSDFELKDGFRIYHGEEIPGFPVHPHRGFETITIVRKGFVDHADSLGAAGRYGEGDVQWMTAGSGVQHSEMFPLLHQDQDNTLELFQIWLNLPKKNKMAPPEFKMLWSNNIPIIQDDSSTVTLICGEYQNKKFHEAPTNSWAAEPDNEVNILLVKLKKGGSFQFKASKGTTNRTLYVIEGKDLFVNGEEVSGKMALTLNSKMDLLVKSSSEAEFLLLEGRPIDEPVFQHGPFVMNTKQEIFQTINDYQRTQFGGWSWKRHDMIHGGKIEKFAKYPDGRIERPV